MPDNDAPRTSRRSELLRHRLHSPLRWLTAVMSGLMVIGLAGIFQMTWLVAASPVVVALFLLAPPIGIYRNSEISPARTRVHLEATEVADADPSGKACTFRLTLVNERTVTASNFRIRLIVPHTLVPFRFTEKMIGLQHVGKMGTHWFVESSASATAVTFRAGQSGDVDAIECAGNARLDLIDLHLPAQSPASEVALDYQVNGGTVSATLAHVHLRP